VERIAIVNFMKGSKGQSRGGMAGVMRYASQDEKTKWGEMKLVSGVNCQAQSAYNDFLRTQLLHHKDNGRRFYHLVQSFPKGEKVDPPQAHLAARRLAEFFEDREVLVCTHTDRDHIHSHLIINAVALESGRKLHSDKQLIDNLMKFNDQVCMEFQLPVFQPDQKKNKTKSISNAEYHVAAKGESWKFQMINVIDNCMKYASTRDEFIELMRSEGYQVKWTPSRKNITYTTPDGRKCRDDRLHEEKYLKEKMEFEFAIRKEIIDGGSEIPQQHQLDEDEGCRAEGHTGRTQLDGIDPADRVYPRRAGTAEPVPADDAHQSGCGAVPEGDGTAEQRVSGAAEFDSGVVRATGWECQREDLLRLRAAYDIRQAGHGYGDQADPVADLTADRNDPTGIVGGCIHSEALDDTDLSLDNGGGSLAADLTRLGRSVEMSAEPVMDATTMARSYTDRKQLRKEHEKKIAQGHARDDHEEEFTFQQSM